MKRIAAWLILMISAWLPTLIGTSNAADLLHLPFDATPIGVCTSVRGSIEPHPGKGEISIVEFDGSRRLRFRRDAQNGTSSPYIDLVSGSKAIGRQFCISYDIYVPAGQSEAGNWQVACNRQTPPGQSVQFQQAATLDLDTGVITTYNTKTVNMSLGEWHRIAVVFDEDKRLYDLYLDDELILLGAPYAITSAPHPERLRIGNASASGDSTVYVDNIRIYNAVYPDSIPDADVLVVADAINPSQEEIFPLPLWEDACTSSTRLITWLGGTACVCCAAVFTFVLFRTAPKHHK